MSAKSTYQLSGKGPEIYEEVWVPALMGPCAKDLVAASDLKAGERILDIACGTGVVCREVLSLDQVPATVVGVDINDGMLSTARHYASKFGKGDIRFTQGDATSLPFIDAAFDVVLCQQGLQFMPDRPSVMTEISRVLAPGGRCAISVWKSPSPFGTALDKFLNQKFGEGATKAWQTSTSLGDRDALRSLAEDAGFIDCNVQFDIVMARHKKPKEFVEGVLSATPLSENISDLPAIERRNLVNGIITEIATYMDDGGIAYPNEVHTLTAQKPLR